VNKYLYKINYVDLTEGTTNLLYTPSIISDTVMFMDWNPTPYHEKVLSDSLLSWFFAREVCGFEKFQGYSWAPENMEINQLNRRIYFKWYGNTLNHIIMDPSRDINIECPDWKEQLNKILTDIVSNGYVKVTLYPHCFYLDDKKRIHTFDFYGCIPVNDCLVELSKVEDMIGGDSVHRFAEARVDDNIDFSIFFDRLLETYLDNYWIGENPFPRAIARS